jgi:hypothetical protein
VFLAVVALAVVTSCQQDEETSTPSTLSDSLAAARSKGWDREVRLLKDGTVSVADVEQAWSWYAQCITEGGGSVGPASFNPMDSVNYGGLTKPEGLSEADFTKLTMQTCGPQLNLISGTYAGTHTRKVAAEYVEPLAQCLHAAGINVAANGTALARFYTDLGSQSENVDAALRCSNSIVPRP